MIAYNADGSVTLSSDIDPTITQKLAAGSTQAQVDAAVATFFAANPGPVPQSVSAFQAKAALLNAGLMPQVTTAVNAASQIVQLAWAQAETFDRNDSTIAALATALGLSSAQVDNLFRQAALITV